MILRVGEPEKLELAYSAVMMIRLVRPTTIDTGGSAHTPVSHHRDDVRMSQVTWTREIPSCTFYSGHGCLLQTMKELTQSEFSPGRETVLRMGPNGKLYAGWISRH